MTLPQTGYSGWQCPSCKQWIPMGQSHACTSYSPQYYTYQPYIDPAVLERIAKALETIATQLTMRATDPPSALVRTADSTDTAGG